MPRRRRGNWDKAEEWFRTSLATKTLSATTHIDARANLGRALEGEVVTEYIENDRSVDVRLRLPRRAVDSPRALEDLVIHNNSGSPLRLGDAARVTLAVTPAEIRRLLRYAASAGSSARMPAASSCTWK